jgi:hypothetical protein
LEREQAFFLFLFLETFSKTCCGVRSNKYNWGGCARLAVDFKRRMATVATEPAPGLRQTQALFDLLYVASEIVRASMVQAEGGVVPSSLVGGLVLALADALLGPTASSALLAAGMSAEVAGGLLMPASAQGTQVTVMRRPPDASARSASWETTSLGS